MFSSGGIIACHKLCHDLRSLGREAYILGRNTHPLLNASQVNRTFKRDELVVIYPEVIIGNPLKSKHVVRWILNTPGECAGMKHNDFYGNLKNTDIFFKYSDAFKLHDGLNYKGLLTTFFIDTRIFNNEAGDRNHTCYLIKKGGMTNKYHPDDSINVSNLQEDHPTMAAIFKKSKYLYCYDNECFWVVLAAVCGCIPIIIPNGNYTADDWYEKFPHKTAGIAYGMDNLKRAEESINSITDVLTIYKEKHLSTVKNLINICETL